MLLEFNLKILPVPHQSVRGGKNGFYQPKKIDVYKSSIQRLVQSQLPPNFELYKKDVPLKMQIIYYFKYRKSEPKKNIGKLIYKVTTPDLTDNLNKAFVDSLAGLVFQRDQQICWFMAEKYWYKENGIRIAFQTLIEG